jgi:hypothetical protein
MTTIYACDPDEVGVIPIWGITIREAILDFSECSGGFDVKSGIPPGVSTQNGQLASPDEISILNNAVISAVNCENRAIEIFNAAIASGDLELLFQVSAEACICRIPSEAWVRYLPSIMPGRNPLFADRRQHTLRGFMLAGNWKNGVPMFMARERFELWKSGTLKNESQNLSAADRAACCDWLKTLMIESPDRPLESKDWYFKEAQCKWPGLKAAHFSAARREAIAATGSQWGKGGRKPKSKRQQLPR